MLKMEGTHSAVVQVCLGVLKPSSGAILPLLAAVGGFWLFRMVLEEPDPLKLTGLALYGICVMAPIFYRRAVK